MVYFGKFTWVITVMEEHLTAAGILLRELKGNLWVHVGSGRTHDSWPVFKVSLGTGCRGQFYRRKCCRSVFEIEWALFTVSVWSPKSKHHSDSVVFPPPSMSELYQTSQPLNFCTSANHPPECTTHSLSALLWQKSWILDMTFTHNWAMFKTSDSWAVCPK